MGINLIVLGFAPMNRLHIKRLPQDKGTPFLLTQVRQPIPGETTFHAADEVFPIRGKESEKGFRSRRQILMHEFDAVLIEHADIHRAHIDAPRVFMLVRVKVPPGLLR